MEDEFEVTGGYQNPGKHCAQEKWKSFQDLNREYHYLPKVESEIIMCFNFHQPESR